MAKMVNPEVEVVRFENEDVVALSMGRRFSITGNGFSVYGGAYNMGWHFPSTTSTTGSNSISGLIGQMSSAYGIPSNTSANNISLSTNEGPKSLQDAWNEWSSSSSKGYGSYIYGDSSTNDESGVTTYTFYQQQ